MSKQEFEERMSKCLLSMLQTENEYRTLISENKTDKERMATISDHIDEMERHARSLRKSWQNPESIRVQDLQ